jgi:hypothetical protein
VVKGSKARGRHPGVDVRRPPRMASGVREQPVHGAVGGNRLGHRPDAADLVAPWSSCGRRRAGSSAAGPRAGAQRRTPLAAFCHTSRHAPGNRLSVLVPHGSVSAAGCPPSSYSTIEAPEIPIRRRGHVERAEDGRLGREGFDVGMVDQTARAHGAGADRRGLDARHHLPRCRRRAWAPCTTTPTERLPSAPGSARGILSRMRSASESPIRAAALTALTRAAFRRPCPRAAVRSQCPAVGSPGLGPTVYGIG